MRWFYLHRDEAQPAGDGGAAPAPAVGEQVVLDPEESHHLLTVMRRRRDEPVHLVDGRGNRCTGRLAGGTGREARIEITGVMAVVADMETKKAIRLDLIGRRAMQIDLDEPAAAEFTNPIERLRKAKPSEAKRTGEETIEERLQDRGW